jgi:FKBP-type peptidyl-prolyl cis-trans isomerase 2
MRDNFLKKGMIIGVTLLFIWISLSDTLQNSASAKIGFIKLGDCADVNYIGRYASNNTIFDTTYDDPVNKTGGAPLKIFVNLDKNVTSPKDGYSSDMIKGFIEGLIGMREGQTKIIGPISPEDAYGKKFGVGAIFSSKYFAFDLNQTVIVTNYTATAFSAKWIEMNNWGNFTMPNLIIRNLSSYNESEMVIYPPPYYIWENSTSIINIADTNVTVRTTPTKSTNLSSEITDIRDGEKQMLIFPNATNASWTDTTITVISSPIVGQNYTIQIQGYPGMINVTIHINSIIGDIINVTITNDQNPTPTYLEVYRILTFNRTYSLPRLYKDIPSMYMFYFYQKDIEKAGYSFHPLAGETLIYEVTVEKLYKTTNQFQIPTVLKLLFERFPNAFPLLRQLMGK